ncbi:MAG: hypothetical protein CYPHOPRED_001809 [Cyphobasidiales sp. Tagirdzhanova-0007]|nr:MAG: hypothetical protein CYPHOPRED_001809 [Cyphobasidiales sp. Tagirdzhanova-0007]
MVRLMALERLAKSTAQAAICRIALQEEEQDFHQTDSLSVSPPTKKQKVVKSGSPAPDPAIDWVDDGNSDDTHTFCGSIQSEHHAGCLLATYGTSRLCRTSPLPSSPILRLPTEILRMIICLLDSNPLAILSLLFVSRLFYNLLTGPSANTCNLGKRAMAHQLKMIDMEWKRRTNAVKIAKEPTYMSLGTQRKSPGCVTWRETYFRVLRRRCIRCCIATTAKFGCIWPWGPTWAVMCESRQHGSFNCIGPRAAAALGANRKDLALLPYKWANVGGRSFEKEYLESSVQETVKAKREAIQRDIDARNRRLDSLVLSYEGDRGCLRTVIDDVAGSHYKDTHKLPTLVRALLRDAHPSQNSMKAIEKFHTTLVNKKEEVKEELEALQLYKMNGYPRLDESVRENHKLTWLDSLVSGHKKVADFIQRVQVHHAKHLAKIEENEMVEERRRLEQENIEETSIAEERWRLEQEARLLENERVLTENPELEGVVSHAVETSRDNEPGMKQEDGASRHGAELRVLVDLIPSRRQYILQLCTRRL